METRYASPPEKRMKMAKCRRKLSATISRSGYITVITHKSHRLDAIPGGILRNTRGIHVSRSSRSGYLRASGLAHGQDPAEEEQQLMRQASAAR